MTKLYSIDQSREICEIALQCATDRSAMQPIILDISELDGVCSMMMIMSVQTNASAKALSAEIIRELKDQGYSVSKEESSDGWYLVDVADLFIHVMTQEKRDYYQLEEIWKRANKVDF